jgi:hypothetical protein
MKSTFPPKEQDAVELVETWFSKLFAEMDLFYAAIGEMTDKTTRFSLTDAAFIASQNNPPMCGMSCVTEGDPEETSKEKLTRLTKEGRECCEFCHLIRLIHYCHTKRADAMHHLHLAESYMSTIQSACNKVLDQLSSHFDELCLYDPQHQPPPGDLSRIPLSSVTARKKNKPASDMRGFNCIAFSSLC